MRQASNTLTPDTLTLRHSDTLTLHQTHQPTEDTMPTQREWTILLYMAGDNGDTFKTKQGSYSLMAEMTGAGYQDIAEVEQIGTTDQVAVLAQFDTLPAKDTEGANLGTQEGGTYRLRNPQGSTVKENIVEIIPEVNTGDPAELSKFIVWGMNRCPAKRTMLVLWNHGMGWKDDDIYVTVRRHAVCDAQARSNPLQACV